MQKLIAEDAEFGIEVKSAVINKLAKSYVKSLENKDIIPFLNAQLNKTLYGTESYGQYIRQYLDGGVKELIHELIKEELKTFILEEINKTADEIRKFISEKNWRSCD